MSQTKFDLEKLLSPYSIDDFFNNNWEKEPLVIQRQESSYYSNLLTIETLDRILSTSNITYPTLRLVKNGSDIPSQVFTKEIYLTAGYEDASLAIDVERVVSEYQQGATIIVKALHQNSKNLSELCNILENYLSSKVQTNIYFTPKLSQGFAPHYDTHDVFILQISGSKRWKIYEATKLLPFRNERFDPVNFDPGILLHDIQLNEGDLIYIPRGYGHEALTSNSSSLHVTVGILSYTWLDLIQETITLVSDDLQFRKSLPIGFANEKALNSTITDEFGNLLKKIVNGKSKLEQAVENISEKFISTRHPLLEGYLTEIEQIDKLDTTSTLKKRPNILYKVIEEESNFSLLFLRKRLQFPKFVRPPLDFILSKDDFIVEDIPNVLDNAGKIVLVKRLLKEGFLTFG